MATKSYVFVLHLDGIRQQQNIHRPVAVMGDKKLHRKGGNYTHVDLCHPGIALERDTNYSTCPIQFIAKGKILFVGR